MPSNTYEVPEIDLDAFNDNRREALIDYINSLPPETIAVTFFIIMSEMASHTIQDRQELEDVLTIMKSKDLQRSAVEIARNGGFEALMEEFGDLNSNALVAQVAASISG